jgi:hypothetical protein
LGCIYIYFNIKTSFEIISCFRIIKSKIKRGKLFATGKRPKNKKILQ